jgi:hypothetical protein
LCRHCNNRTTKFKFIDSDSGHHYSSNHYFGYDSSSDYSIPVYALDGSFNFNNQQFGDGYDGDSFIHIEFGNVLLVIMQNKV